MVYEASSRLPSDQLIGRRGRIVCSEINLETSFGNYGADIDVKSLTENLLLLAFDLSSDATLLSNLRYAEHAERLHWHCVKANSSSLPAVAHDI